MQRKPWGLFASALFLSPLLYADPPAAVSKIEVKKGDCGVVAKSVENRCAGKKPNVVPATYESFVDEKIDIIKKMYAPHTKDGNCEQIAQVVNATCDDMCAETNCTWVVKAPEADIPNQTNIFGFYESREKLTDLPVPPDDSKLNSLPTNKKTTLTDAQPEKANYVSGTDEAPPAAPNIPVALNGKSKLLPAVYIMGTPGRKKTKKYNF